MEKETKPIPKRLPMTEGEGFVLFPHASMALILEMDEELKSALDNTGYVIIAFPAGKKAKTANAKKGRNKPLLYGVVAKIQQLTFPTDTPGTGRIRVSGKERCAVSKIQKRNPGQSGETAEWKKIEDIHIDEATWQSQDFKNKLQTLQNLVAENMIIFENMAVALDILDIYERETAEELSQHHKNTITVLGFQTPEWRERFPAILNTSAMIFNSPFRLNMKEMFAALESRPNNKKTPLPPKKMIPDYPTELTEILATPSVLSQLDSLIELIIKDNQKLKIAEEFIQSVAENQNNKETTDAGTENGPKNTGDKHCKKNPGGTMMLPRPSDDADDKQRITDYFQRLLEEKRNKMPPEAQTYIQDELERLKRVSPLSQDYHIKVDYLERLLKKYPWGEQTRDNTDLKDIYKKLDNDHYGLKKPKTRFIEFAAAKKFNPRKKAPILCFIGPPGTGKTSLGISIARALGRKFVRISVGGVRDEAEIRGHRRTYIGALPGKIIEGIMEAGTQNPVFMIDEIDKFGWDIIKGDPAAALLEALDPEQNSRFVDHYMSVGVDLSQVIFILTGNTPNVLPALLDRTEIIFFPSYGEDEKIHIAEKFIVPKQLKEHGLFYQETETAADSDSSPTAQQETNALARLGFEPVQIKFTRDALVDIIQKFTRETGVREVERKISKILQRIQVKMLEQNSSSQPEEEKAGAVVSGDNIWLINTSSLPNYLHRNEGILRQSPKLERDLPPGVAPMIAVGANGAEVLYVEACWRRNTDHRKLKVTGFDPYNQRVGRMIEESIDTAWDFLFKEGGLLSDLQINGKKIEDNIYLRVHLPDGSTPKDGTSAGIAFLWAIYSLFTNQKVKPGIVATGEITLVIGKVRPIGAAAEKIMGVLRACGDEIVIPEENKEELEEAPVEIRNKIKITFCKTNEQALKIGFPDCPRLTNIQKK